MSFVPAASPNARPKYAKSPKLSWREESTARRPKKTAHAPAAATRRSVCEEPIWRIVSGQVIARAPVKTAAARGAPASRASAAVAAASASPAVHCGTCSPEKPPDSARIQAKANDAFGGISVMRKSTVGKCRALPS